MTPFTLKFENGRLLLTLCGEVTIEHAQSLASALREQLTPDLVLAVDASQLARFDASILQILLSCAQKAADTRLEKSGEAWPAAFSRYASPDPFRTV